MKKQNKMVSFSTAVQNFWTKYVDFRGTSTRAEYWWTILFLIMTSIILAILTEGNSLFGIVAWLFGLAVIIPGLALTSRRFHDAGWSARWYFYPLLTAIALKMMAFVTVGWPLLAAFFMTLELIVEFALAGLVLFVAVQPTHHVAGKATKNKKSKK